MCGVLTRMEHAPVLDYDEVWLENNKEEGVDRLPAGDPSAKDGNILLIIFKPASNNTNRSCLHAVK